MAQSPATAPIEPTSHSYVSQGLKLHCLDWGNAGAPLLILLHGTSDHARSWDRTALALRDKWHVVAPDLRGHGDSAWSPDGAYLVPYHVLDLTELLARFGEEPMTIVAHSFGAGIGSRFAALFPDRIRKIVMIDGFGPSPDDYANWAKAGPVKRLHNWINQRRDPKHDKPRRFATIEDAAARLAVGNPRLSPEQAYHLAAHGVRLHPDGYGWKFDPRVSMFTPEDFSVQLTDFWSEIPAPALLCYGANSWTPDPEANGLAASLRDRRTIRIENAGHWPHHDQFDTFTATLLDFL